MQGVVHRLAIVTVYYFEESTEYGIERINKRKTYKTDKVIKVESIKKKVILTDDHPSCVLHIPCNIWD